MKILKSTFALALLGLAFHSLGLAEEKEKEAAREMKQEAVKEDHILMKDGKVVIVKDGKTTLMEKETTLGNGAKVSPNGILTMKDDEKILLKEGAGITLDGKLMEHRVLVKNGDMTMKDGKMMIMKNGVMMRLEISETTKGGAQVLPDGSVITKDGKKMTLDEGDTVTKDDQVRKQEKKEAK